MKMDPLVYVCAVVAVMLPVLRWLPLMFYSINHEAFTAQIVKLLKAGNAERALKLCNAVPRAFYVAMMKALLEAGQACKPDDGEGIVSESLRDAFQREQAKQLRRARNLGFLAPIGVLVAAAGLFLAGSDPAEPAVVYAPPVITVMLWIGSVRKVGKLRDRSAEGLEQILPLAVAHYTASSD